MGSSIKLGTSKSWVLFCSLWRYSLNSAGHGFLHPLRESAHSQLYVITLAQQQDYNQGVIRSPDSDMLHILLHHAHQLLTERDMAQCLERGALSMSLPAVQFWIRLGAGFSEKYHVSPLSMLGHCFDVVSLGKALNPQMLDLTQVKMSTW